MDQPPDDPLLVTIVLAVSLASVATWIALIWRRRREEPLLPFEPRSPVPWGALIAMLAVVFVAVTLLTPTDADVAESPEAPTPFEVSQRLVGFILFQSVLIAGVLFIVVTAYRPSLRDLGLPMYAEELARDIWIGIVTCLAALAPVYGVQLALLFLSGLLDEPPGHPLVQMVTRGEPSLGVVFLATIGAVVVAPVGEEILFRLLLQGWLEKCEDRWIGWREAQLNDEARMTNDEMANDRMANDAITSAAADGSPFDRRDSSLFESPPPPEPPPRGLAGFPYGWFPILISSFLFAVAHVGYGPDPIALFLLAIFLGFVFQRTHRIVPCMVAHAMFNSVAMLLLWRAVYLNLD